MKTHTAIIGAGIAGLSHATLAAQAGHQVTVFEHSPRASGASVRNFGMLWAIGQPAPLYPLAIRSLELWHDILKKTHAYHRKCGSLHLAMHEDETAVLEEFADRAPENGYNVNLLTRSQVEEVSPVVHRGIAKAGLYSPTETNVDPREILQVLPEYLTEEYNVRFKWNQRVVAVETGRLTTADKKVHQFDQILVCSGAELESLFPEILLHSGIKLTKLQMLRTTPQPKGFELGPLVATGLTLRHYDNFKICPSISKLQNRIALENPLLDKYGIHVMASQDRNRSLVLGDSHEYEDEISPFDKEEIDRLILEELRKHFHFPDWSITERWHGVYGKIAGKPIIDSNTEPLPGVFLRTGLGGTGMTLSFGLADQFFTKQQSQLTS